MAPKSLVKLPPQTCDLCVADDWFLGLLISIKLFFVGITRVNILGQASLLLGAAGFLHNFRSSKPSS